jgi:hypothetical protein
MDLWAISNQCINIWITDEFTWNSNPEYFWEGLMIAPFYPFLKLFIVLIADPLKPLLRNVGKNISFLNINNCFFSVSCDWCSIANGVLHLCALKVPKVTGPFSLITAHFPLENGRFE